MPSSTERSRALARHLIALEESRPREAAVTAEVAPLEACYQLHRSLCRFVGTIGCETVSLRALRAAQPEHPVLSDLTVHSVGRPYFDGIPEALRLHGAAAVAAALEEFLASLLTLLARFVGDDVVSAITDQTLNSETGEAPDTGNRQ